MKRPAAVGAAGPGTPRLNIKLNQVLKALLAESCLGHEAAIRNSAWRTDILPTAKRMAGLVAKQMENLEKKSTRSGKAVRTPWTLGWPSTHCAAGSTNPKKQV